MSVDLRILDSNWAWESGVSISISGSATINSSFPLTNLTSFSRSKVVRSSSASSTLTIVLDMRMKAPVDSFVMVFPINSGPKISSSATITLMASQTNSWSSPAISQALAIDTTYGTISHFFTSVQNYRYWAVQITDTANPYGYIEVGKIFLSKSTLLTQSPEIGFPYSLKDLNKTSRTDYGHSYVDVYPSLKGFAFNYSALSSDDLETLFLISDTVGSSKPVMLCLDPLASLWDKDRFQIYGYLRDFSSKQLFYSYFDTGISIEESS